MNEFEGNQTDIPNAPPSRRRILAGGLAGIAGGALAMASTPAAAAAETLGGGPTKSARVNALHNAGAGMHVGPDTAMGISTFTINPHSVTCGVGSLGNSPGAVPGTAALPEGLGTTGPFTMMMYATRIDSYTVDVANRQLIAKGVMRSITTAGTLTIEDVLHPFVSVGTDNRKTTPDVFKLHFLTPFWSPDSNPMASRSTLNNAWAMFGSALLLGEINVG